MKKSVIYLLVAFFSISLSACSGISTADAGKQTVAAPSFSPAAGSVADGTSVAIGCATDGATIQYSTDGYSYATGTSIAISSRCTVYAKATKSGYADSKVSSAAYSIAAISPPKVALPAISVDGAGTTITIACATSGALIQYSTDNITYTTGSSFTVNANCKTVYATATASGYADSPVASAAFTLLRLHFEMGTIPPGAGNNIYVSWIENSSSSFLKNLVVCNRVLGIGKVLTGTALPYWKKNKYSASSEVDAVTGATIANSDFNIVRALKDTSQWTFSVYFETDRSFDPNDWFTDQPAIVYKADVNLDTETTEYIMNPIGWSRSADGTGINKIAGDPASSLTGALQAALKYITDTSTGTPATQAVKKASLQILR